MAGASCLTWSTSSVSMRSLDDTYNKIHIYIEAYLKEKSLAIKTISTAEKFKLFTAFKKGEAFSGCHVEGIDTRNMASCWRHGWSVGSSGSPSALVRHRGWFSTWLTGFISRMSPAACLRHSDSTPTVDTNTRGLRTPDTELRSGTALRASDRCYAECSIQSCSDRSEQ